MGTKSDTRKVLNKNLFILTIRAKMARMIKNAMNLSDSYKKFLV